MKVRCYPHSSAASAVIYAGVPEWEHGCFVRDYLAPGDVFVDVGANIGVYSLIAAGVSGTEVVAYEPSTASFARLAENIELNRVSRRVHAQRLAVGDRVSTVSLSVGRDTTNVVLGDDSLTSQVGATEPVEQTTLDASLDADRAGRVAVVKIDVEGREDLVLAGAEQLLRRVRPVLVIEANDVPALRARLEPLGYVPCAYDPDTGSLTPIEWDATRHPNVLAVADPELVAKKLAVRRS